MKQRKSAPTSRVYLHDRCEQPTVVSGDGFAALASPLTAVSRTYCNACKSMFAVDEFRWADTNEKLPDYFRRHAGGALSIERFIASRYSAIVVLVLAVLIGLSAMIWLLVFQGETLLESVFLGIGIGAISLIVMAAVLFSVLTPLVHLRVCKVSDPRWLV